MRPRSKQLSRLLRDFLDQIGDEAAAARPSSLKMAAAQKSKAIKYHRTTSARSA